METILVIESNPAHRVALALILRSFGYAVLEASSRGEAWRVCHYHRAPIHLVMAKASPDDDSTSKFVTRLQLLYPRIRAALFVFDAPFPAMADMPCEYAFLQEPFRVDTLACSIRELLDSPRQRAVPSVS